MLYLMHTFLTIHSNIPKFVLLKLFSTQDTLIFPRMPHSLLRQIRYCRFPVEFATVVVVCLFAVNCGLQNHTSIQI